MKRFFSFRVSIVAAMVLTASADTNAQVTLQKWTEVFGTTPGQALGRNVSGITPSANLPYKASISSFGSTGLYTLQTQNDTGAQRFFFGTNMLTGDLNGDGWKDIVLKRGESSSTLDTIVVYYGGSEGIDTLNPLVILSENPGDGLRPAWIGDVDNDGKPDLILRALAYPRPLLRGKVYIYLNPVTHATANYTIQGDTFRSGLGMSCAVGDLNNDGWNDLCIRGIDQTAPPGPERFGYVNIYWGVGTDTVNTQVGLQLRGYSFADAGMNVFDANGDGIDDLLWTNRDSLDWVYIHYGGTIFDTIPSIRLRNPGVANFGNLIFNAGDMSGDGNIEIGVAASLATITSGFVFIFEGGNRLNGQYKAAAGMQSESSFGASASNVGDVSGDGLSDIMIGAPTYEFGNSKGYWGIFKGDSIITSVRLPSTIPDVFILYQAYPNPFNPSTTIRYDLKTTTNVILEVIDVQGKHVATLANERNIPGSYQTIFDGSRLSSGVYLYRLTATTADGRTFSDTKKLTLIK